MVILEPTLNQVGELITIIGSRKEKTYMDLHKKRLAGLPNQSFYNFSNNFFNSSFQGEWSE